MKKTSRLAKILAVGAVFGASLFAGSALAQDINEQTKPETQPRIELNIDYFMPNTQSDSGKYSLIGIENFSSDDWTAVSNFKQNVRNGTISSYSQMINNLKQLPEQEQRAIVMDISNMFYSENYDMKSIYDKHSQDEFFRHLQEDLNGNPESFGVCTGISLAEARTEEDLGNPSSVMSTINGENVNHAIDVTKVDEGIEILDGYQGILSDTKNVEEAIRQYQINVLDSVLLQSSFFGTDGKLKYILTTPEGRQVIDMLGYDPTTRTLDNKLLGIPKDKALLTINLGNYEKSADIHDDKSGFELMGGILSFPDYQRTMRLIKFGWDKDFRIRDKAEINPRLEIFGGSMPKTTASSDSADSGEDPVPNGVIGGIAGLMLNTTNKSGINLGLGYELNLAGIQTNSAQSYIGLSNLYYDQNLQAGASYSISGKVLTIKPYASALVNILAPDIIAQNVYVLSLQAAKVGAQISSDLISINPYMFWKLWEYGGGADIKFGNKNEGINVGVNYGKSTYEFAPDEFDAKLGFYLAFRGINMKINYSKSAKIYDREPTVNDNLTVGVDINLPNGKYR